MAGEPVQDPLAELRDIHLPAPPDLWPPAPGWWLLVILGGVCLAYLIYLAVKHWRSNAYRRHARKELEQIFANQRSPSTILSSTNDLLKRVALTRYPRDEVAHLTGEQWVAFLDASAGIHEFTMGAGEILIDGPYGSSEPDFDESEVFRLAEHWIQKHQRNFTRAEANHD